MSIITSIKQQKKKDRVNVYLDGKFGFGIDLENFVKLKLKVEQELDENEIGEIVKKAEFQKTLEKLLRFAMVRPRSRKEIKDWMRRKEVSTSLHTDLFEKLKHFELIDDNKFAKWWVEQRQTFRPKSKRVLVQELKIKGIGEDVISDTFSEVSMDEDGTAFKLLSKKIYRWEKLDRVSQKQKMYEYLGRLGFNFDTIKSVVAKTLEKG